MDPVAADVSRVGDDFERLFRASYPRLVVALTLLADRAAAEDAAQDAFVQALRHWEKVRHYDDPAAWVRRAALNRLANQRRGSGRRDRAVARLGAEPAPTGDTDHAGLADLRAALAELPERERTVVVLHHVIGVPVADVAAELELAEGTVKSVLSRTRDRLRAVLEPAAAGAGTDGREGRGTGGA
jgi:RNA polymerase sigma-70 factor (ECF subfamily)